MTVVMVGFEVLLGLQGIWGLGFIGFIRGLGF